jgi:sigma-B regulation protein RsbU (phosphoserine phosphatase)
MDMVYDEGSFTLAPGDVLFLYTDGVSEAMDEEDRMFTEPRIGDELGAAVVGGVSCESVVERLLAAVRAHADGVEQFDDVTMLAFRYLGPDAEDAAGIDPAGIDPAGIDPAGIDTAGVDSTG